MLKKLNWPFLGFIVVTVVLATLLTLYVLSPLLDKLADWLARGVV